ncbi:MAG TPA: UDP-N-acetylmuramate dehydrogenase [Candidatus Corynebacterium gallistercoris]|uniref:UDP-N-acetylenolpyruvoylglucosamine reductase n=1 Tax=Candidatus Corynebacterium gallistercoris TaxID=2838530 RepID=A0A9D1RX62_9CORY|nr:UDP-N-acetylmuramate dehydrogenase [Candidatus Corynebacterium gallistercoris]
MTTLRIGGAPAGVVACRSPRALAEVVSWCDANRQPFLVLGGGSNLVVGSGDEVSELLVVLAEAGGSVDAEPDNDSDIEMDLSAGVVRAYAGVVWDDLVEATVQAGLGGLECLSGIPGSVGATPVQNVGAYGAEVSQTLKRVQLLELGGAGSDQENCSEGWEQRWRWVDPAELNLGYRYSNLKFTGRAVVTAVEFQLSTDGLSVPLRYGELARRVGVDESEAAAGPVCRPVAEVRENVLALRAAKGMVLNAEDHDTWSAGSFFTNPIVTGVEARDAVIEAVREECGDTEADSMPVYAAGVSAVADQAAGADVGGAAVPPEQQRFKFSAAWLIERAGFSKGWHVPGNNKASLSTKHTLALTNRGGATSEDIVELARAVRDGVRDAFGVELEPEPIWIGAEL